MRFVMCFATVSAYAGHFAARRAEATIMADAAPARRLRRVFSAGFPAVLAAFDARGHGRR
ncbi:hypothetical protein [Burkholderia plantarii]|uniref:hypothetical protein n=1 Tax=Burkholderia plantarii TaxID=41899 RepID=UPI00114CCE5C|nr:hypothetical protein [Burkholderia plantarii]